MSAAVVDALGVAGDGPSPLRVADASFPQVRQMLQLDHAAHIGQVPRLEQRRRLCFMREFRAPFP